MKENHDPLGDFEGQDIYRAAKDETDERHGQLARAVQSMAVGTTFEAVDETGREHSGTIAETSETVMGAGKWFRRRWHLDPDKDSSRMAAFVVHGDDSRGLTYIMDDGARKLVTRLVVDGEEVRDV